MHYVEIQTERIYTIRLKTTLAVTTMGWCCTYLVGCYGCMGEPSKTPMKYMAYVGSERI